MAGLLQHLPGANLVRQAWDATKLAGAIMDRRRERALVLAEERQTKVAPFRGRKATERVREAFESGDPAEVARLYLPEGAVNAAKDANYVFWRVWDIYWLFAILRVVLVLWPQHGYIHPDEFFQTVEVVAGDALGLDVHRTWEFNVTAPIRSMTLPGIAFGTPLLVMRYTSLVLDHYLPGLTLISSYTVLLAPRLVMLFLSFTVDYCVYQICVLYQHNFNRCLTTLASSYVMLVYSTRTLTNSLELAMTSWLLYLVALCMKRSSESLLLQSIVKEEYDSAETVRDKVKVRKKLRLVPSYDYHRAAAVGALCAAGFFLRPTFAAFAAAPVFFWLQRGLRDRSYFQPFVVINFRATALLACFALTAGILVLTDSLYYGELTLRKLWDLEMDWSDWKVAPFHFVMYNTVQENLEQHGAHPKYLHAIVNVPLLFGPLGICTYAVIGHFFFSVVFNRWGQKPSIRNASALATFTLCSSLVALSLFPHQEPRFLLPLAVPCVLLGSNALRRRFPSFTGPRRRPLLTAWYAFNVGMLLSFGFCHQGGVLPVVRWLGEEAGGGGPPGEVPVVFTHTYMPPRFPLLQSAKGVETKPYLHGDHAKRRRYKFVDLSGAPESEVATELASLALRAPPSKARAPLLVAAPHVARRIEAAAAAAAAAMGGKELELEELEHFFPHVSAEAAPDVGISSLVTQVMSAPSLSSEWLLVQSERLSRRLLGALGDASLVVHRVSVRDPAPPSQQSEDTITSAQVPPPPPPPQNQKQKDRITQQL